MLTFKKRFIFLAWLSLSLSVRGEELKPLTPAEADAIIEAREQATTARQEARLSELEKATVKSEGRGVLPGGQAVIIREVEPPANAGASFVNDPELVDAVTDAEPQPKQIDLSGLSSEQLAQFEAWQIQAEKEHKVVMLSATVYDREVTRLSWQHDGGEYVAYTNADFNYLRGVHSVVTDTHDYSYFTGIGDASRADNPYRNETVPSVAAFSEDRSEHLLLKGDPDNPDATAGLEALLAHYDANLKTLKIEFQRNQALAAAQKRYDAANPKEPEPFILQFWVPETSEGKTPGE